MRFSRNVSNQVGSALNYKDGKSKITVQWEQPKRECTKHFALPLPLTNDVFYVFVAGGCIFLYPEPCEEEAHCVLCYILLVFLLIMICCGTRSAIVRKHGAGPPVVIKIRNFMGELHDFEITGLDLTISEVKSLYEKNMSVPADELHLFDEQTSSNQLQGDKTCRELGLHEGAELLLSRTWSIFVREMVREKDGSQSVEMHNLEGVEVHWHISTLKQKVTP
jgi:hypothetical protein